MTISPIGHRRPRPADTVVTILVPVSRKDDERPAPKDVEPPATPRPAVRLCRCGHEEDAHQHFRSGEDCGVCGPVRCRSFRLRTGRRARSSARR